MYPHTMSLTLEAQVHILEELVVHVVSRTFAIPVLLDAFAREHPGAEDPLVPLVPAYLPVQGPQLVNDVGIVGGLFLGPKQVLLRVGAIPCKCDGVSISLRASKT